ncbi:hypothetical protein Tco_0893355 [Tanacetum coccineum]|uniref:Uncharacterized protein n=1 Tax=Tanacetum coccineum TaxID=301880 RepID=A0ABQ5CBG0_9ASTR
MSQEIMHINMNAVDILDVNKSCVIECNKCLELETELLKKKDFIEKDVYDKLVKRYSTLEKYFISLELATQLNQEIFQKDNSGENQNAPTFNQLFEINELKAQSQEKDTVIRKLKDRIKSLTGNDSVEKLDIEHISHRLKNNRDAHEVYLEKTIKNTSILRGLVECAREQNPRVNTTTSASGSKPSGNTKTNRITRLPNSNQKNKVEEYPRNVKSSLNKTNSISESIINAHVKHSMRNAKFESICAICSKYLFDANHDMCLIDYVNDVKVRSKSKSK